MRQNFKIEKYNWSIIIYYTVNDTERKEIIDMLEGLDCDSRTLESITTNLTEAKLDTGFAYSSYNKNALL